VCGERKKGGGVRGKFEGGEWKGPEAEQRGGDGGGKDGMYGKGTRQTKKTGSEKKGLYCRWGKRGRKEKRSR